MALEPQHIRALVAEIASPSSKDRELAAEKVADWITSPIDPRFASILARALESILSIEDSSVTRESQLNAISQISGLGLAPKDVIQRIMDSGLGSEPWANEYVEGLADDLPYAPDA